MGEKNWPLMQEALEMLKKAYEEGLFITFDVFPYTTTGTVLHTLLPDWATEGGKYMMLNRIKDPAIRSKIIADMKNLDFDFSKIKNKGKVSEEDLNITLREIKLLLLEADVNYKIVNEFVNSLKEDIVGKEVYKSLKPEHIIIKSVNDKLVELFSAGDRELHFKGNPAIIELVGLQGSGKQQHVVNSQNCFKKMEEMHFLYHVI